MSKERLLSRVENLLKANDEWLKHPFLRETSKVERTLIKEQLIGLLHKIGRIEG